MGRTGSDSPFALREQIRVRGLLAGVAGRLE
jgi:hypothetical protein